MKGIGCRHYPSGQVVTGSTQQMASAVGHGNIVITLMTLIDEFTRECLAIRAWAREY
jgi:hypothetical protein